MGNAIKKELKLENVWFVYPKPEAFYTTLVPWKSNVPPLLRAARGDFIMLPLEPEGTDYMKWKWPPMLFVVYRVLLAVYVVSFFVETTVMFSIKPITRHNIMTFLTTWTYLVLTLHLSVSACTTIYSVWKSKQRINQGTAVLKSLARRQSSHANPTFEQDINIECNGKSPKETTGENSNGNHLHAHVSDQAETISPDTELEMEEDHKKEEPAPLAVQVDKITWYMKLSWMLYDIICITAPIVSVVYFTTIYPQIKSRYGPSGISLEDLNVHGINSVIVFVEMCLTSYPVRLLHALYPVMYGFAYVVFSLSYWSSDPVHNVLYPGVLDWNSPGKAIMVVLALAFIGIPFLQFIHFGFYQLKLLVYRKLYGRPYLE